MFRLVVPLVLAMLAVPGTAQEPTHKLLLKKEAEGDRAKISSTEVSHMSFTLELMGQEMKKVEKKTEKLGYTEEILQRPADAKRATKLRRRYTTAEETKEGKTKPLAYHGKTVLIEKTGEKFTFSIDGEPLQGEEAEHLEEEFNKKDDIPLENEDLLPNKPVKVGETWQVDVAKVARSFESGLPFSLDRDQTRITGKLVKAYTKDGKPYGVIEMNLNLAVKELKVDGQELPLKAGSKISGLVVLDTVIDGTSHTGSEKAEMTFDLVGEIPNGSLTMKGTVKYSKSAEDLAAK